LVREDFVEAFKIPAGSMLPTLLVGDRFMVDKFSYRIAPPERGDVMVFASPENLDQDYVKRNVANPGDRLEVKQGHPWINGWEVPHCKLGSGAFSSSDGTETQKGDVEVEFLNGHAYLTFYAEIVGSTKVEGPFLATNDECWVLGDNRNNSYDSRSWFEGEGGGVPTHLIKGKALFIWLHSSSAGVDWSRFGMSLSELHLPASMRFLEPDLARCMQNRPAREQTVPPRP